jgi:transcriptional regulator with XRE-family HTH domain
MHRTYLAGIERALRNPSLENLVKLAKALGVTLPELFAYTIKTIAGKKGGR